MYLLPLSLFDLTAAILVRPTVALGHGVHLSLVSRQRAAGSGRWRVFRRVCLLFGACSLKIRPDKKNHIREHKFLIIFPRVTLDDCYTYKITMCPTFSYTTLVFRQLMTQKGHGFKTRPWNHHLQSYDTSLSYRSNHRVILSLSPHGNAADPQGSGEKQYWNSG